MCSFSAQSDYLDPLQLTTQLPCHTFPSTFWVWWAMQPLRIFFLPIMTADSQSVTICYHYHDVLIHKVHRGPLVTEIKGWSCSKCWGLDLSAFLLSPCYSFLETQIQLPSDLLFLACHSSSEPPPWGFCVCAILIHLLPLKFLVPHSLITYLLPLPLCLDSAWPSANSNLLYLKRMSGPYTFTK